jgi:hypothetical protein
MTKFEVTYKEQGVASQLIKAEYWVLDQGQWFDFYADDNDDEKSIVTTVNAGEVRSIVRASD